MEKCSSCPICHSGIYFQRAATPWKDCSSLKVSCVYAFSSEYMNCHVFRSSSVCALCQSWSWGRGRLFLEAEVVLWQHLWQKDTSGEPNWEISVPWAPVQPSTHGQGENEGWCSLLLHWWEGQGLWVMDKHWEKQQFQGAGIEMGISGLSALMPSTSSKHVVWLFLIIQSFLTVCCLQNWKSFDFCLNSLLAHALLCQS